jgi:hypothetical protein
LKTVRLASGGETDYTNSAIKKQDSRELSFFKKRMNPRVFRLRRCAVADPIAEKAWTRYQRRLAHPQTDCAREQQFLEKGKKEILWQRQ